MRRRVIVIGTLVLAALSVVAWTTRGPSRLPPHFWVPSTATYTDTHAFTSPTGDELRGWRFGDFLPRSRGFGYPPPPPGVLDAIREPSLFERALQRVGLKSDDWDLTTARGTWDDGAGIHYVAIPDEFPSDVAADDALAGEWEEDYDGSEEPERVVWRLEPGGRLVREHRTTARRDGRWTRIDDVLYLEWFGEWAPDGPPVLETRLLTDARTWRGGPTENPGRRR